MIALNEPSCELSSNLYLLFLVTIMHVKEKELGKREKLESWGGAFYGNFFELIIYFLGTG